MSEEEKCSNGKKPEEKTISTTSQGVIEPSYSNTTSPALNQPSESDHQGKRRRSMEYFEELRSKYYDT